MPLTSEIAITRRLLQLRARGIDKIKNCLKATLRLAQRMAGHHHPRAAMPLALMLERKLNFHSFRKVPLRQKADPLGRPLHLLISHINGVRKADGDSLAPGDSRFILERHNQTS